mmetsp:Transcript_16045/g.30321  ORF Transcript_16045/g.30321 Transcript_16045/m.30321 type:complete len:95 (-) Transcript_16045:157-441(-)
MSRTNLSPSKKAEDAAAMEAFLLLFSQRGRGNLGRQGNEENQSPCREEEATLPPPSVGPMWGINAATRVGIIGSKHSWFLLILLLSSSRGARGQ